jgi:hypothetical protein
LTLVFGDVKQAASERLPVLQVDLTLFSLIRVTDYAVKAADRAAAPWTAGVAITP